MTFDRRFAAGAAAAVLFCAVLIVLSARGDLWLDEIWSISFARGASTPLALASVHHDNNHFLNSVYLYLVRWQRSLIVYRALAIVCGIGSVIAAGSIARRWGKVESIAAILLTGTSYPLALYFSEARGYAAAMFCALAAYWILERHGDDGRLAPAIMFWIACIAGTLAHLTFAMATLAFAVAALARRRQMPLARLAVYHAPPILFTAAWYAFFTRDMVFGRGPVYPVGTVVMQATAMLLALPAGVAIVAFLLIVAAASFHLYRRGDPQWLFFPMICIASPAVLLIATHPRYFYFRYFIICFPFFYLAMAYLIGRCSIPISAVLVLLVVGLHAGRLYTLIEIGRGHYRDALLTMSAATAGGTIRVGSDDDSANGAVLNFYSYLLPPAKKLRYVPLPAWEREPPEWFIYHRQQIDEQPPGGLALRGAGLYGFVARYPFEGTSGFEWLLFRRRGNG